MFDLLNNTQTFPFLLTHCCAKPEKSLPGSWGQNEQTFNKRTKGTNLTYFASDSEAATRDVLWKKVFLEILQNFLKKGTLAQ